MPVILEPLAPIEAEAPRSTLANVEREVARRTGPFAYYTVAPSIASSQTRVQVDDLLSTLPLGGFSQFWLLRRGLYPDGQVVDPFYAADRQRQITTWASNFGFLEVDRPYQQVPLAGEAIEISYLNPSQVIRPAVLAGLRRCVFEDRTWVTFPTFNAERDLTAVVPWLTRKAHLKTVDYGYRATDPGAPDPLWAPCPVQWWKAYERAGHLWLTVSPDPWPQSLYLGVNRPAHTLVNGEPTVDGPFRDGDVLQVPLEYAAAAGHIECWRIARHLLMPGATAQQGSLVITQAQAADEFTRQQRRHLRRRPAVVQLSRPLYAVHGVGA